MENEEPRQFKFRKNPRNKKTIINFPRKLDFIERGYLEYGVQICYGKNKGFIRLFHFEIGTRKSYGGAN